MAEDLNLKNQETDQTSENNSEQLYDAKEVKRYISSRKYKRKVKRALRITRCRALKNFMFWLLGVLSSFGILAGSIFIGLKFVPLSTFLGKDTASQYVSKEVYNSSILDFILNINSYGMEDFPILQQSLEDAMGENELVIFTEYQSVDTPALTETVVNGQKRYVLNQGSDYSKYYYESDGSEEMSQSQEKTYKRAFDDDGVLIASLCLEYEQQQKLNLFIPPLSKLPLTKALSQIPEYLQYLEVSDILNILSLDDGTTLLQTLFKGVKVGDFLKDPANGGFSFESILGSLTLESIGGAEVLSSLANFDFFSGYVPVTEKPGVDAQGFITKNGEKFSSNPKLYYIKISETVYGRAFSDQGEFYKDYFVDTDGSVYYEKKDNESPVKSFNSFADVDLLELCYANLAKTPLLNAFELLGDSFGRQTVNGLLNGMGFTLGENSAINDILGSYKLSDFAKDPQEGGFSLNSIKLSVVLGEYGEQNSAIYDLMCKIFSSGEEIKPEDLTIGHLVTGQLDFETLLISDFIELDGNTLDFLCDSINEKKYAEFILENDPKDYVTVTKENLTIGDFSYFEYQSIKLTQVIGEYSANSYFFNVILSAKNRLPQQNEGESDADYLSRVEPFAQALSISDLSGLNLDNLSLTVVLDKSNTQLYKILLDALEMQNPQDIKFSSLQSFNQNKIRLSSVLDMTEPNNVLLCGLLAEATGTPVEEITIEHFAKFDMHVVKLSSVLYPEENETFYEILAKLYPNVNVEKDLTLAGLKDFSLDNLTIGTVLPESSNPEIYKVFTDALNLGEVHYDKNGSHIDLPAVVGNTLSEKLANVKLSEIEHRLDIVHIHLSTVLEIEPGESTGNAILDVLLQKNTVVGEIAEDINTLTLYEVFGSQCFVAYNQTQHAGMDRYKGTETGFILDEQGEFVLNEGQGMWQLMCFNVTYDQTTGKANAYTIDKSLTMQSLQENSTGIMAKMFNATIRQLVDAGILDDGNGFVNTQIYKMSIVDIINMIGQPG